MCPHLARYLALCALMVSAGVLLLSLFIPSTCAFDKLWIFNHIHPQDLP
jgi:hypothetical protein